MIEAGYHRREVSSSGQFRDNEWYLSQMGWMPTPCAPRMSISKSSPTYTASEGVIPSLSRQMRKGACFGFNCLPVIILQISEQPGLRLFLGQTKTLSCIGEGLAEIKKDDFDHNRYRHGIAYSKMTLFSRLSQSLPHLVK